jgi:hypothetical protein
LIEFSFSSSKRTKQMSGSEIWSFVTCIGYRPQLRSYTCNFTFTFILYMYT